MKSHEEVVGPVDALRSLGLWWRLGSGTHALWLALPSELPSAFFPSFPPSLSPYASFFPFILSMFELLLKT